eukprot:TRINITY_DN62632_c0_g1_i1.p1 TRINITY_DN62632_c0_g1~~TRINITY_DN62632_c0_g1_i1.p1  ORF type:complete len:380 (-),score=43.17 TRINITY_DN62632_c0_g1_i1:7-1146(-)
MGVRRLYLITVATICADAVPEHKCRADGELLQGTSLYQVHKPALHRNLSMTSAPREEAWAHVPDVNVTFSSSFCCNESASLDNMLASLAALRFCFTNVYLIIDVPHGGVHIGREGRYPGGPGGNSEFLRSTSGTQLLEAAQRTAQRAVALLQSHCPLTQHPLTWNVETLNYDTPEMHEVLLQDFGVVSDEFFFDTMYLNTMAYAKLLHLPDTQYVWHSDSDWRVYRVGEGADPNFIGASISLMRSDMRVMSTALTITHRKSPVQTKAGFQSNTPEQRHDEMFQAWGVFNKTNWEAEYFDAKWPQGEAPATTYSFIQAGQHFFSSQQFLMDVERGKTLLPFGAHAQSQPFEISMKRSLSEHALKQVWFDESVNVICGFGI